MTREYWLYVVCPTLIGVSTSRSDLPSLSSPLVQECELSHCGSGGERSCKQEGGNRVIGERASTSSLTGSALHCIALHCTALHSLETLPSPTFILYDNFEYSAAQPKGTALLQVEVEKQAIASVD